LRISQNYLADVQTTSQEIADHVAECWRRGQQACLLVRAELGDALADEVLPMKNGGVLLHKLQSTMHDACNGANLAARLIALKKEASGAEYFGEEAWAAKGDEEKATLTTCVATTPEIFQLQLSPGYSLTF
jgi:hypothetical protein